MYEGGRMMKSEKLHVHWEFESVCPQCERANYIKSPAGEQVVSVICKHCRHGYEYTHIVREHIQVEDPVEWDYMSSVSCYRMNPLNKLRLTLRV